MSKPLSKLQKAKLAQAARRAFDYLTRKGQLPGIDFDTWRHDECERVTGQPGLRECGNADFNKLAAHFESLAGEDGRALNHLVRESTEPKRQAEVVLLRELTEAGLPLAYAEKISRDKFNVGVLEADARQTWHLIYTIRNRARAKSRRAAAQSSTPH